jgi:DNA-binding FadR family transcriptional regulator
MSEAAAAEVHVPKAAELVAAQLRRQIVMGERLEGEMLPSEPELVAELGVSRPTLRQALRILETELLVQVKRGRNGGTRVSKPSPDVALRYLGNLLLFQGTTLDDVHVARTLLEPTAVAALASTITADQVATLRDLVEANRTQTDPSALRDAGSAFHAKVVGMTGNEPLALFAMLVQRLLDGPLERYESHRTQQHLPSRAPAMLDDHGRLVDLLEAGATREAARHWRLHLDAVHETLKKTVDTTAVLDLEI